MTTPENTPHDALCTPVTRRKLTAALAAPVWPLEGGGQKS